MELMANRNTDSEGQAAETQPIFVAMTDIGMGDLLTSQVLKLEQWPKDKVPAGAISKIEDVEGRRSRARLYPNEPILEDKLLGKGASQQGASALIPKDYRLATVKVDAVSGSGSLILPGDRVDVMIYLVREPDKGINETVTRTILQDVKVFAVNDVVIMEKDKDGNKSIAAKTISLLVTPEQAAKIDMASHMGSINLVMRSPDDDKQGPNVEARPGELLGNVVKSERSKESLTSPPKEPSLNEKAQELLQTLKSSKSSETWTMRVLKPGAVDEVMFEANSDKTNSASPSGGWKVSTTTANLEVSPPVNKEPVILGPPAQGPVPPIPGPFQPNLEPKQDKKTY
jgi:pilus assembly protein CpaB